MKRAKTLSRKIVLTFSVISAGILVIVFGMLKQVNQSAFSEVETEKARIIAETVEPLLALNIYLELGEKKQQLVQQLLKNPNILAVRIYENNRLSHESRSEHYDQGIADSFTIEQPIMMPNTEIQIGQLELVYSNKRFREVMETYTEFLFYLILGLGAVYAVVAFYIRRLLSPLRKLARIISSYRPDREQTFPYAEENNEIGIISGALNEMHASVYANFMQQREKNIHLAEQVDEKEKVIDEANQRFKEVFNNTVFGIWMIDKNQHTLDTNRKLLEMLGYERHEILGANISECVAKKDKVFFRRKDVLSKTKPDKQQFEISLVSKTGEEVPAYFHWTAVRNRNGQIIGAFAFIEDLREKRLMQAELERKTRTLEQLNSRLEEEVVKEVEKRRQSERRMHQQARLASMGELIVAISHNWRNPLASLGLVIQDLEDAYDYGELDRAYLRDSVEKALERIDFMSHTIDDFSNFFRPEGDMETFNVSLSVERAVFHLEKMMEEAKITVNVMENVADYTLDGYPVEVQKVLEKIMMNARDAILERREKESIAGEIVIDYGLDGTTRYLSVRDNGGGVPESIQDKVFDPYFTTKDQGKGTGLDLYIAKVVIETNMSGRLSVRNEKDGAVFKIEFNI